MYNTITREVSQNYLIQLNHWMNYLTRVRHLPKIEQRRILAVPYTIKPTSSETWRCAVRHVMYYSKFLALCGATGLPGGDTLLMLEIAVIDREKYYDINYAPAIELTPAQLETLMLPELGEIDKGVVLRESGKWWLDAHIAIEYSKVASWVAMGTQELAIVVFSVDDQMPIGTIINY